MKHHAVRRVAGNVIEREFQIPQLPRHPRRDGQELVDLIGRHREDHPALADHFLQGQVGRVIREGVQARPGGLQRGGIHHVIEVLVREQHGVHPHPPLGDPGGDALGRIDEEISLGGFGQVAVGFTEAAGVEGEFHAVDWQRTRNH